MIASAALSLLIQELSYAVLYCIAAGMLLLTVEKRFVIRDAEYVRRIRRTDRYMRPLAFVAGVSYPLYLIHQFVGFAIIRRMEMMGLTSEAFIIVPMAVVTCLAFLVQKGTDRLTAAGKRRT